MASVPASEKFDPVPDDLGLGRRLDVPEDLVQNLFDEGSLLVEGHDADRRPLPFVVEIKLGDGDIESGPQTILEAPEEHSFVLERVGVGEKKLKTEQPDDHNPFDSRRSGGLDFLGQEGLDDVPGQKVLELLDPDSAFVILLDLVDVLL